VSPPDESPRQVRTPRGRYAPSPTGEVHLGNASSALLAWLSIRARGGSFVMRMEDLDRNRVRPGLDRQILDDLAWLGLDWDEGPDNGGPYSPYEQWARRERYAAAFERLKAADRIYPCFCSRKDIAAAASAPQSPGDEVRYPGTCRDLEPAESRRRFEEGARHAWRFRVEPGERPVFVDAVHGEWGADQPDEPGDFVVARADGVPAYQLAVVVDDAEMRIDEVVRGDDLLPSTARQLLLYDALGWARPAFGHVPLLLGTDGIRLSKRHEGTSLAELRRDGFSPQQVVGRLAWVVGLRERPDPIDAAGLVEGFALERVPPVPEGIRIDPSSWR
jgi:glutamyl-tRNA synthetase